MHQEHAAVNGVPQRNPTGKLGAVSMAGIFVDAADAGGDLDLIALDAHGFHAIVEKAAKGAAGLEAHQQHCRATVP